MRVRRIIRVELGAPRARIMRPRLKNAEQSSDRQAWKLGARVTKPTAGWTQKQWYAPTPLKLKARNRIPPGYGFAGRTPVIHHGPYEYSVPGEPRDYVMQTDPLTVAVR